MVDYLVKISQESYHLVRDNFSDVSDKKLEGLKSEPTRENNIGGSA